MADSQSTTHARELLSRHPLIDGHNDLPWAMRLLAGYDFARADPCVDLPGLHTDLPRLREGGVGAQFWSVFVPSNLPGDTAVTATLEQIDFVHQLLARLPNDLGLALSAADVERVFRGGRIASLLGAEGGQSIGCSLGALRALFALGVRYMTLTHNDNNPWADSATDVVGVGGLSAFGKEVVREMNRLGMLVDLSHVAPSTMADALDTSEAPVIFSHSSCRAVVDHPRNVPDAILERTKVNGGVCMITFVPYFVSKAVNEWWLEMRAHFESEGSGESGQPAGGGGLNDHLIRLAGEYRKTHPTPPTTIADVVVHIEHAREVMGIEHVGLGGDYDGVDILPDGLSDVSSYPRLIAALLDAGWSDEDCAALAGGNLLRVMRANEELADRLRRERPASVATIQVLDGLAP